jgi:murein endopeptidase
VIGSDTKADAPGGRPTPTGRALLVLLAIGVLGLVIPLGGSSPLALPIRAPATTATATTVPPPPSTLSAAQKHDDELAKIQARIKWRPSVAVGSPANGKLINGVELPGEGVNYVTWDSPRHAKPNRGDRRWGTNRLITLILKVSAEYAAAHPDRPRLVIGDLSREHGGNFGPQYGGDGHASHQNGLDADVWYPRKDGAEVAPHSMASVDWQASQELVDRFLAAGARLVFVGPHTPLRTKPHQVEHWPNHDDHMHVRLRPAR